MCLFDQWRREVKTFRFFGLNSVGSPNSQLKNTHRHVSIFPVGVEFLVANLAFRKTIFVAHFKFSKIHIDMCLFS